MSGRIIGRRGTCGLDGGMQLAERYSDRYSLAKDAFWVDLRRLARKGLIETVVRPCPNRKAVYALVLAYEAIPAHLPEDLARLLGVDDLPEPQDPHEDSTYGRLTDVTPAWDTPVSRPIDAAKAKELEAAPRWEHPAHSKAAQVAADIKASRKALPEAKRPDLRCSAIAPTTAPGDVMMRRPETSPLYAKGSSPDVCSMSDRKWGLSWPDRMEKTERTPQRAAGLPSGDDPRVVADRVLSRAWASWRRELGYGKVILRSGEWAESGQWQGRSAWSDLRRLVGIALRRTTESALVEVLTASVAGAEDVGRLAAWRLWRIVNSHRHAHGYGHRREVPVAAHVAAWEEMSTAERQRQRAQLRQAQAEAEERRRRTAERQQAAQRALYERWGLAVAPPVLREPEAVHQAVPAARHDVEDRQAHRRDEDAVRAAAIRQARQDKRERRRRG